MYSENSVFGIFNKLLFALLLSGCYQGVEITDIDSGSSNVDMGYSDMSEKTTDLFVAPVDLLITPICPAAFIWPWTLTYDEVDSDGQHITYTNTMIIDKSVSPPIGDFVFAGITYKCTGDKVAVMFPSPQVFDGGTFNKGYTVLKSQASFVNGQLFIDIYGNTGDGTFNGYWLE